MGSKAAQKATNKKIEYKAVDFDINEIAPDAPEGEWKMSVPRGKCKVQPTKEDHFPMIVMPVRLDKVSGENEDSETHTKAVGTELSTFLVFGGKTPRGERMNKLRIRQVCELLDIDLDVIPKKITDPENDLEPLIRELEGKKFVGWTAISTRRDTGEEVTDLVFVNPDKKLSRDDEDDEDEDGAGSGKDDDGDDDEPEEKPRANRRTTKKAAPKAASRKK